MHSRVRRGRSYGEKEINCKDIIVVGGQIQKRTNKTGRRNVNCVPFRNGSKRCVNEVGGRSGWGGGVEKGGGGEKGKSVCAGEGFEKCRLIYSLVSCASNNLSPYR